MASLNKVKKSHSYYTASNRTSKQSPIFLLEANQHRKYATHKLPRPGSCFLRGRRHLMLYGSITQPNSHFTQAQTGSLNSITSGAGSAISSATSKASSVASSIFSKTSSLASEVSSQASTATGSAKASISSSAASKASSISSKASAASTKMSTGGAAYQTGAVALGALFGGAAIVANI